MAIVRTVRTVKGEEISAYALANNLPVEFTSIAVGSGTSTDQIKNRVALVAQWKTVSITSVEYTGSDKVRIRGVVDNTGITENVVIKEIGLFASSGSASGLYAYGDCVSGANSYPDTLPPVSLGGLTRRVIDFVVSVANAPQATFTVSEDISAPEDLEEIETLIGDATAVLDYADGIIYPKTLSGVLKKIYDLIVGIKAYFITEFSTLKIENGGTGASTAAGARSNLGITLNTLGGAATGHTHPEATQSLSGFLSATDKTKLDSINKNDLLRLGIAEKNFSQIDTDAFVLCAADETYVYRLGNHLDAYNTITGVSERLIEGLLNEVYIPGNLEGFCTDGLNLFFCTAGSSYNRYLCAYNKATQEKDFLYLPYSTSNDPRVTSVTTDGVNVYLLIATNNGTQNLGIYNIANKTFERFTVYGVATTSVEDDGILYVLTKKTGNNIQKNFLVRFDLSTKTSLYTEISYIIANIYNSGADRARLCIKDDYIYMLSDSGLVAYNKNTHVYNLIPGTSEAVIYPYKGDLSLIGDVLFWHTNDKVWAYNINTSKLVYIEKITTINARSCTNGKNYYTCFQNSSVIQIVNPLFTASWGVNGLKVVAFQLYNNGSVDFEGSFASTCFFAGAISEAGAEAVLTSMAASGAVFTIQNNVQYNGIAIGI